MPVPASIADLSITPGANSPPGSESPSSLDDYQRAHAAFIAQLRDRVQPVVLGGTGATSIPIWNQNTTGNAATANAGPGNSAFSMRNRIINGNFGINQRGYVSGAAVGAANTYTLDRWRVVTSGQNLAFVASGNGNSVTAPAGGLEQVIEGVNIEGGTYVAGWVGVGTCTVNGTARAKGETFTLTANTNATVRVVGAVSQFQLEPGTVATPFERRPIGLELALCQRYALVIPVNAFFAAGTQRSVTAHYFFMPTPVPMRTGPTTTGPLGHVYSGDSTGGVSAWAGWTTTGNGLWNGLNSAACGFVGSSVLLYSSGGPVVISAEL